MVITRRRVEQVARDSGFRPGTVEKVLRLRVGKDSGSSDAGTMQRELDAKLSGVGERLIAWRPAEQLFLDRLHDQGEVDAEALHPDPAMHERIQNQPMLQWKAQDVREHRRGRSS